VLGATALSLSDLGGEKRFMGSWRRTSTLGTKKMSPQLQSVMAKIEYADLSVFEGIQLNGPNIRGRHFGDTPLHVVAVWGDDESARVLIAERAEIDARGEHSFTPLHEAVQHSKIEVVKLLLENGADPYLKSDLGDAFDLAEFKSNSELTKLLRGEA
jgi:ankyrin repeat protein